MKYTRSLSSNSLATSFQSAFQIPLPPTSSNVGVIWISTFELLFLSLNLSLSFLTHIYGFEYYLRLIISQTNFSPELQIHMSSFIPRGHSGTHVYSTSCLLCPITVPFQLEHEENGFWWTIRSLCSSIIIYQLTSSHTCFICFLQCLPRVCTLASTLFSAQASIYESDWMTAWRI